MGLVADYSRGEPAPIKNDGPSMHDLVIEDMQKEINAGVYLDSEDQRKVYHKYWEDAKAEMLSRKEFGLKKYETILQAYNGREPINDMIDELGDALVYAKQSLIETEAWKESEDSYERVDRSEMEEVYESLLYIYRNFIERKVRRGNASNS
jgi:hypothetical protein